MAFESLLSLYVCLKDFVSALGQYESGVLNTRYYYSMWRKKRLEIYADDFSDKTEARMQRKLMVGQSKQWWSLLTNQSCRQVGLSQAVSNPCLTQPRKVATDDSIIPSEPRLSVLSYQTHVKPLWSPVGDTGVIYTSETFLGRMQPVCVNAWLSPYWTFCQTSTLVWRRKSSS